MQLRVSAKPSALAVVIGVIELLLSEFFKFTSDAAAAWHRRRKLYRTGRFRIRSNPFLRNPDTFFSSALLAVLLALTLVLELSISSATFPDSSRVPRSHNIRCFGPKRETRYFNKHGPRTSELGDDRVAAYVTQANCRDSLIDLSIQGPAALGQGYPGCLPPFESQAVDVVLAIQGGAVGFVANSEAGDPHLDYGIERDGEIAAPDMGEELAGTSFWHVMMRSKGGSVAFWTFGEQNASQRIASNLGIPTHFLEDSPQSFDAESVANVSCFSNSLTCFLEAGRQALAATAVLRKYEEDNLGVLVSSLKDVQSSLCIFESRMQVEVSWVYLNLFIPEVERNGRNGPTITRLKIKGNARCLPRLPRQSARMYLDSMERIDLNETMNATEEATFDNMRDVLQKAAVITGLKTLPGEGVPCQPKGVVNGSTVGTAELVAILVFSAVLLVTAVILMASSVVAHCTCPIRTDPFNALWPVQLLVEQRGTNDDELRDACESRGGSDSRDTAESATLARGIFSNAEDLWVGVSAQDGSVRLTAHTSQTATLATPGRGSRDAAHSRSTTSS